MPYQYTPYENINSVFIKLQFDGFALNPIVILLLVAMLFSFLINETLDGLAITFIIIIGTLILMLIKGFHEAFNII